MQEMQPLGKLLIIIGAAAIIAGALVLFWGRIPCIGKLPGDFNIEKPNFKFYFPLGTSIALSLLFSLILWLISYISKK